MSRGVALEQGEAGEQGRARGRSSKEEVRPLPETSSNSSCKKEINSETPGSSLCSLPGGQGQPSYCPAQLMEATICQGLMRA